MERVSTTHVAPGSEGLLSPLQSFLENRGVSEILINKPQEVFVEKQGLMTRFGMPLLTAKYIRHLFTFIANENGQILSEENPMLSGHLYDGSRVQLVIPPASRFHTLSIRRPSIQKRTLQDYEVSGFYNEARACDIQRTETNEEGTELLTLYHQKAWGAFIARAIELKKNIVISGQTSSGKTTYLNACTAHIPHHERIITLEDTYEIDIPHANTVNLCAIKKINADKNGLSMQDLVQCALRLRPDRLIMGEIRGREVLDFISACSTGHEGSITSIHANNPRMAFMRMTQLYKLNNVPSMRDDDILRELHAVIDIIVQIERQGCQRMMTDIYFKDAQQEVI